MKLILEWARRLVASLLASLRGGDDEQCTRARVVYSTDVDPATIGGPGVLSLAGTQHPQAGLPPETIVFWNAIRTEFPEADGLGSWGDTSHQARVSDHNRVTSSHRVGPHAIDVMTASPELHRRVIAWALAHRGEYGISLAISGLSTGVRKPQKWSPATGWKPAAYRGTSGHYDHVHLSNDGVAMPVPAPVPPKPAPAPKPTASRATLRQGSTGPDVVYLQQRLGVKPANGAFGSATQAKVVAFQTAHKLDPDGVVGKATWAALG